jgi:hypothetical protein
LGTKVSGQGLKAPHRLRANRLNPLCLRALNLSQPFFFLIVQFCTNVVEKKMERENSVAYFLFYEGKNGEILN